jgi:outer membrane receptor protein involved in Fe transport
MRKSVWLLSAGLFAISTPAYAQQADASGTQVPPTDATSAAAGAVTQDEPQAVSADEDVEIVVTAQGRVQVLQDVPIAVTAIGGEALKNSGATDIRQLNQLAPSLLVSSTGSEANGSWYWHRRRQPRP